MQRLFFIIFVSFLFVFSCNSGKNSEKSNDTVRTNTKGTSSVDTSKIKEIIFSKEDLEKYYKTYENPFTIAIRTNFDLYFAGKLGENETVYENLKKYEEYIKHKFIVLEAFEDTVGGLFFSIIFPEKDDKAFIASVYKVADENFELRIFEEEPKITPEEIKKYRIMFKFVYYDKQHCL